jgi:hypothetical protein
MDNSELRWRSLRSAHIPNSELCFALAALD